MVKWVAVISYGSLLKFSDSLNYISEENLMCIFFKYCLDPR